MSSQVPSTAVCGPSHVRPVAAADAIHKAQRRKAALLGEGHGHLSKPTGIRWERHLCKLIIHQPEKFGDIFWLVVLTILKHI